MHDNSLSAYREGIKGSFKSRQQRIFEALFFGSNQLTDREILRKLFPYSDDCNKVRPRVSEMLKSGALKEVGTKIEGELKVRIVALNEPVSEGQQVTLL